MYAVHIHRLWITSRMFPWTNRLPSDKLDPMSSQTQIKVPRHAKHSPVEKALEVTAHDGKWHRIAEMGMTTAEQTARSYNVPGARWELGFTHETNSGGEIVSILWARWIG